MKLRPAASSTYPSTQHFALIPTRGLTDMPITKIFLTAAVLALASPVLRGDASLAAAPALQDDAEGTYRKGREALVREDFRAAADLFHQITRRWPKAGVAPDALYWRAYALNRLGRESDLREARSSLETMLETFPNARASRDAKSLAAQIDGRLARLGDRDATLRVGEIARRDKDKDKDKEKDKDKDRGDREGRSSARAASCPDDDDDNDMRIAAINAVMQMDAQNALPILRQVLAKRDACSEPLRRKAVFILSQKASPEAAELLVGVARNDPSREVREQAVHWMGQMDDPRAIAFLEDVALRSTDDELRKKAIFALVQKGNERAMAIVRQLAERGDVPGDVRQQAVFWLGQHASPANAQFLRGLFAKAPAGENGIEFKKKVMFSLSQMHGQGNDRWLMSIANDASQPIDVRKHALWTAGQAGIAASELIALYARTNDREMKEHLIWVLSQEDERAAVDKLFDIARRDPDVQMRKKALFWLGQKNDPRVQQLLLELIDKG